MPAPLPAAACVPGCREMAAAQQPATAHPPASAAPAAFELPDSPQKLLQAVLRQFERLPGKGKPQAHEYSVLAGQSCKQQAVGWGCWCVALCVSCSKHKERTPGPIERLYRCLGVLPSSFFSTFC